MEKLKRRILPSRSSHVDVHCNSLRFGTAIVLLYGTAIVPRCKLKHITRSILLFWLRALAALAVAW